MHSQIPINWVTTRYVPEVTEVALKQNSHQVVSVSSDLEPVGQTFLCFEVFVFSLVWHFLDLERVLWVSLIASSASSRQTPGETPSVPQEI